MSRNQSSGLSNTAGQNANVDTTNANSAFGTVMPSYQAELANPGYTAPQQAAITGATEGGAGAAFGSGIEGAANRAARTNNAAGLTSTQDALTRAHMVTSGQLGAQNQTNFANDAQRQKQEAQQGIQGLYGTSLTGANNALSVATKGAADSPSFWDQFGGAAAGAAGEAVGSFA